jgi:hypothetical protein
MSVDNDPGPGPVKLLKASYGAHRGGYYVSGEVVLRNLAPHKTVRLVHSFDDWATVHEHEATFHAMVPDSGGRLELWVFQLPLRPPGPRPIRFAIAYTVSGTTYWDNNDWKDYVLTYPQSIP